MVFVFQSYGYGKNDDDKQEAFDLVWYTYLVGKVGYMHFNQWLFQSSNNPYY
jgi:hypothetical protein